MVNKNNDLPDVHQPHDTGYKYLLTSKRIFKEMLDSFVKEGWVDKVDADTLRLDNKTYILPDFSKKESDLVYHLTIEGQEVVFYILLELQSTIDFQMPHRLLFYMIEIWRHFLKNIPEGETKRKGFRLPAIVPMVLYNGDGEWTIPQNYRELLSGQELFADHVLNFKYILIDINRFHEEELLKLPNLIKTVFLMDRARNPVEIMQQFHKVENILTGFTVSDYQLFKTWVEKILSRGLPTEKQTEMAKIIEESDSEEVSEMISNVERVLKEAFEKTQMDSLAIGKLEGREEGREEGIFIGEVKGREEGKLEVAERMLGENLSIDLVVRITGLSYDEIAKITPLLRKSDLS
ncbi:MAG: Rpn family recombination-promoting nuclease/putative transposase [Alkaliphilus sp.]